MNEPTPAPGDEGRGDAEVMEEGREEALDFLEGLLDAMELDGRVTVEIEQGELAASVEGEEAGVLIGRGGQTLAAIQDLLRTAVSRLLQTHVRISLDIEGYRERRREALEQTAQEKAEEAQASGGEVELEPMPAYERKLVHDAVAAIEGVTSFSEGEDPDRRVIIATEDPVRPEEPEAQEPEAAEPENGG